MTVITDANGEGVHVEVDDDSGMEATIIVGGGVVLDFEAEDGGIYTW